MPKNKTTNRPINIDSEMLRWVEGYRIDNSYNRLRVRSSSPLIGTKISHWEFKKKYNVTVIRIRRRFPDVLKGVSQFVEFPSPNTEILYHDILTVKGDTKDVDKLMQTFTLGLLPIESINRELKDELINREVGMAEVIITPDSRFVGRKVPIGFYFKQAGIQLLAASRNSEALEDKDVLVRAGDAFLIRGTWENIEALQKLYENVVITGSPESMVKNVDQLTFKSYIALSTLILMILLLVLKIVPGAIAALISAGIILITGCVPITKAYKGISWASVVMIAAMIPMGLAMEKTGVAQMAANTMVNSLGAIHPIMLLGGIFLLTTAFSQTINNSATAVLMAPIAILTAMSLGISPKPFMIAVAVSASTAFLTPVGTTTNAMILTAGGYKFMDYVKVGAPLLFIFFIITLFVVPLIWPF